MKPGILISLIPCLVLIPKVWLPLVSVLSPVTSSQAQNSMYFVAILVPFHLFVYFFSYVCTVCIHMCGCAPESRAHKIQKRVLAPPEQEVQVVMSYHVSPGIELRTSGRGASALNH